MEDFLTNAKKVSIANGKFLDICRINQGDWVTCDQAESIFDHIGLKSSARMHGLIGEADVDGLNQIVWENLLGIINYLTTNNDADINTHGCDHFNDGEIMNVADQSHSLPDEIQSQHSAIDCIQSIIQLAIENNGLSLEQVLEMAKEFHFEKKN